MLVISLFSPRNQDQPLGRDPGQGHDPGAGLHHERGRHPRDVNLRGGQRERLPPRRRSQNPHGGLDGP